MHAATGMPSDRLPGLDLLRTVGIVWVVLFHSFLVGGLGAGWAWLSRIGWLARSALAPRPGAVPGPDAPRHAAERLRP